MQGSGVSEAKVYVNGHLAATTDHSGTYTLTNITSGSYHLLVSATSCVYTLSMFVCWVGYICLLLRWKQIGWSSQRSLLLFLPLILTSLISLPPGRFPLLTNVCTFNAVVCVHVASHSTCRFEVCGRVNLSVTTHSSPTVRL